MSVQQEPLKMNQPTASEKNEAYESHVDEPPKLEFANSSESLEAFGAALGGAILGVLATLLILAIINNGTLRFTSTGVEEMRASLTRVDENLGAVNHNVDVVAQRLAALEGEGGAISQIQGSLIELDDALAQQGTQLEELDVTRRNFDAFTAALAEALAEIDAFQAPAAAEAPAVEETSVEAAPAATTAAPEAEQAPAEAAPSEAAEVAMPGVVADASVPANAVRAYLFMDSNGDALMDAEEASLVGATVVLTAPDGETVSGQTTDTGVLFEELQPGEYTVDVEDALGFGLMSDSSATVTVAEDGEEGQIVYFPVEAGE